MSSDPSVVMLFPIALHFRLIQVTSKRLGPNTVETTYFSCWAEGVKPSHSLTIETTGGLGCHMSGLRDAWLLGSERGTRVLSEQMRKLRSGFVFFVRSCCQIHQNINPCGKLPQRSNMARGWTTATATPVWHTRSIHTTSYSQIPNFYSNSKNGLICRPCS